MLLAFPFIFPPPEVNERVSQDDVEFIGETSFREDSTGQDAGHWGRGGIKLYRSSEDKVLVEFQSDFEVGPGPNFWLYLNSESEVEDEEDFLSDDSRIKVEKIKSFGGSQVYALEGEMFADARSLTIWCESFNQYIASANIPEIEL